MSEEYTVWCCSQKNNCKWQGFALNNGLSWGTIPDESEEWFKWHKKECSGKIIQLLPKGDK